MRSGTVGCQRPVCSVRRTLANTPKSSSCGTNARPCAFRSGWRGSAKDRCSRLVARGFDPSTYDPKKTPLTAIDPDEIYDPDDDDTPIQLTIEPEIPDEVLNMTDIEYDKYGYPKRKYASWDKHKYPEMDENEEVGPNSEYMQVDPEYQVFNPERGPLETRIDKSPTDAMQSDDLNEEHRKYWFTEPKDGWDENPKLVKKVKTSRGWEASAFHPGDNRTPIESFKVGQELEGVIIEHWYKHGIKVDLGCQYDGLICVGVHNWDEIYEDLDFNVKVKVRVFKMHDPSIYRWPIQLELLDPPLQEKLMPPEDWHAPIDMRGKTPEEIMEKTDRKMEVKKFLVSKEDHMPIVQDEEEEELTEAELMEREAQFDARVENAMNIGAEVWEEKYQLYHYDRLLY